MASTSVMSQQDTFDSHYLSSSLSDLSRVRSTNSLIVRAYKQATQLYLTKRFREALDTLEPIISPLSADTSFPLEEQSQPIHDGPAPVAASSKGTRTKVWVFYLSLIHAIIELGAEEGKAQFGSERWRQLAAKARNGTVWDEIVRRGYGGSEGDVDPEVVQNLSTLLLGHMQNQLINQQRLETWLSLCGDAGSHISFEGMGSPMPSGASTPKVLNTRLKVLELYALHVLPANDEWDLALGFIEMNDTLDEERREAFQQALESLREEKVGVTLKEKALKEQREREMAAQQEEEARQLQARRDELDRQRAAEAERVRAATSSTSSIKSSKDSHSQTNPKRAPARRAAPTGKKAAVNPPPNLYRRATIILGNLQQLLVQAGKSMTGNSAIMLRALMFLVAFLLLLSRQSMRQRVRKVIGDGWNRVRQTVGMGVKVSYL